MKELQSIQMEKIVHHIIYILNEKVLVLNSYSLIQGKKYYISVSLPFIIFNIIAVFKKNVENINEFINSEVKIYETKSISTVERFFVIESICI